MHSLSAIDCGSLGHPPSFIALVFGPSRDHKQREEPEILMHQLEATATSRLVGSLEPCASVRSVRGLIGGLRSSQDDRTTLEALELVDRALAVVERRLLVLQRKRGSHER